MPGTVTAALTAFGGIAGLALVPFGSIAGKLKGTEPWRGMDAEASVFTLVRAQQFSGFGIASCDVWTGALKTLEYGTPYDPTVTAGNSAAWEPWSKDELDMVRTCAKSPCKVKLDAAEVAELTPLKPDERRPKYLMLLGARATAYVASQTRRGYESGQPPTDAWAKLAEKGIPSTGLPTQPTLLAREIDYKTGPMKPVHQIVDHRYLKQGNEAQLWVRDLYTNHYFDGWGERVSLACDPATKDALLIHALVLELDLMRKTDFLSRLARPRMRSAVKELGYRYLDEKAEGLKKITMGK